MNLIVTSPAWLTIPLFCLLLAAAIEDSIRLRISNVTCGLVFVGAIVAMGVNGLSFALWQNAVVCIAILAVGTPAFAAGWLGGGDVKLLAALGLWINLQAAIGLIAAVFTAGGLLAILWIIARRFGMWRRHPDSEKSGIPYGVAIAAGALFIFGIQATERPNDRFIERIRAAEAQQR